MFKKALNIAELSGKCGLNAPIISYIVINMTSWVFIIREWLELQVGIWQ